MRIARRSVKLGCSAVIAGAIAWAAPSGAAGYTIEKGDVLQISVVGLPALNTRVSVGVDGTVSVPLLGPVNVSGMTLAELRRHITSLLPARALRTIGPDGREIVASVHGDAISVDVVEYRPVYVRGDVARPGEQPFRPGMTIRQAIAVAGGYDLVRFRLMNPFMEAADLKSQTEVLWLEFVKEQTRLWSIEAELGGKQSLEHVELPQAPVPAETVRQITRLAEEKLALLTKIQEGDKAHLRKVIQQAGSQIQFLNDQTKRQEEDLKIGAAELEELRASREKGLVVQRRVTEERRSALLATTQMLYTLERALNVNRVREDLNRDLEKIDDRRRLELLQEMQSARVALASIRSRLHAASEKLSYAGALKSQLSGRQGARPEIDLYRKSAGEPRLERVDESTELFPGDVVEAGLVYSMPNLQD